MNLTLSIDEQTLQEARKVAAAMGKSLNQLIRDHLESLTRRDQADQEMKELYSLSDPPQGDSRGWRFNRDELHERA
jgi:Family of unknown function (DUF6364)